MTVLPDVAPDITRLLKPSGYKILVRVTSTEERREKKTSGGLYVPEDTAAGEAIGTFTGVVMALGPDAYSDARRFVSGPWCQVGDTIVFRAFAGLRLRLRGVDYRLLNDDTVEAVTTVGDEIGRP